LERIYVDKTIKLLRTAGFQTIRFRGDTDFSQTEHLDRWDEDGVFFVFGLDAGQKVLDIAESLAETEGERIVRPPKYEVKTEPRRKACNFKEPIVVARGYRNLTLHHEDVTVVLYRPVKCMRRYRLVILRKTISVKAGQELLLPETRYFFYLTNDCDKSGAEIVFESNSRCHQENLFGQLKSGMNGMSMPLNTLESNGVYLFCACLAMSLPSWLALSLLPAGRNQKEMKRRDRLLRMEFSSFLQAMIRLPGQIVRSGRRVVVRLLSMNDWSSIFFCLADRFRGVRRVRRE
jgi:hypothetical protein